MKRTRWLIYLSKKYIGRIGIFQNIRRLLDFYFFEEIFFVSCIFLVRGIVDKTKDTTNSNVIPTRLQKVRLDSSNSPNETVRYKLNFNSVMNS